MQRQKLKVGSIISCKSKAFEFKIKIYKCTEKFATGKSITSNNEYKFKIDVIDGKCSLSQFDRWSQNTYAFLS